MSVLDNAQRYGAISRFLHWGVAVLLLWQFLSAATHALLEDSWLDELMWATHKPLGFLLLIIIALRLVWALLNVPRRPAAVSRLAALGHRALYALMIVIPVLALIRQYGSGRAFSPFGIPLMDGFDSEKIEWMVGLGNLLHGELAWLLLAFTLGHIVMAFWHRIRKSHEDVLARMWR